MTNIRNFRTSLTEALLALVFIFYSFYTSYTVNGPIFGKWTLSVVLAMCLLMFFVFFLVSLFVRANRVYDKLSQFIQRIPNLNFIASLSLYVLPIVIFFVWFLTGIPIFQRISFFIGMLLLSIFPGLFCFSLFKSKKRKSTFTGLVAMFFSFVIAVILGELLLHFVMPESIFNPRFGLIPNRKIMLEVDLPGITHGGVLTTNMWGLRGEEPPSQWDDYITIVTVGGSTTANYYLDDNLTWSHILQQKLRESLPLVWVGNGGIPRHSAGVHHLFVKEVLSQIKPDYALFLVGVNDMGPFLKGSAALDERLPDTGVKQFLFAHSRILQLSYKIKKIYFDGASIINESVDPYFIELPLVDGEDTLPEDLHDILEQPDFYKDRIRVIIQECNKLNIVPIFMTQPLLYENNTYWQSIQEGSIWLEEANRPISAATFYLMLNTLNEDLLTVCEQEDVAVFDLAFKIPHTKEYFYDCMHMTEKGANLVGEIAAEYLLAIIN